MSQAVEGDVLAYSCLSEPSGNMYCKDLSVIIGNIFPSDFDSPNTLMAGRDKGN